MIDKFGFHGLGQGTLIDKYSVLNQYGVCYGLTIEAARHHIHHYGTSSDNYLVKLDNKYATQSNHFLDRVCGYQDLQIGDDYRLASLSSVYNALGTTALANSKFIGFSMMCSEGGHQIGVKIDMGSAVKTYVIYDPNFGESQKYLSIDAVGKALIDLVQERYPEMTEFGVKDFERCVKEDYRISCSVSSPKSDKYSYINVIDGIVKNDMSKIYTNATNHKDLLSDNCSKAFMSFHGNDPKLALSPLHLAAQKMDANDFTNMLSFADLKFDKANALMLSVIMQERGEAHKGITSQMIKIIDNKYKLAKPYLNHQDSVYASKVIETLKKDYAPTSFHTTISSNQVKFMHNEIDAFYKDLETNKVDCQVIHGLYEHQELPLVSTELAFDTLVAA